MTATARAGAVAGEPAHPLAVVSSDGLDALDAEIAARAELDALPWTCTVTEHEQCAEYLRSIGVPAVSMQVDGWLHEVPHGAHVLLVDRAARVAGDLVKSHGVTTHAVNTPPPYRWPSEFLEQRAAVSGYAVDSEGMRELWRVVVDRALLIEVAPTGHPDLKAQPKPIVEFLRPWQLAELPPRRFVWRDVLAAGDLGMLFGPWGTCKSFIAQGVAAAIADGTPFLGREVAQGPALTICGEGAVGQADRQRAIFGARMTDRSDPLHDNLGVACSMPALTEPAGFDGTVRAIETFGKVPSLLIVDTYARAAAAAGIDENSTGESGKLVAALDRLRDRFPGMALLTVHHSGNDRNDRSRGSSALPSACDVILRVDSLKSTSPAPRVRLSADKVKDGRKPPPLLIDFLEVPVRADDRGQPVTSLRVGSFRTADVDDAPAAPRGPTARDLLRSAMGEAGANGINFDQGKKATTKVAATVSEGFSKLVADGEAEPFVTDEGEKRWRLKTASEAE